jgi:UDP-N-acetylmuramate--alanine ligase
MNVLDYSHFYLVGIKGVAMTALAQCLLDAGKTVEGSDLAEEFVTQPLLKKRNIPIDLSFSAQIPSAVDCVIYTAAHQSQSNPQVQAALARQLPTFSHAEAVASLFNQKKGVAVCGVGGKSTTSAMIAWILEKVDRSPSFAVGVGDIPGLGKTGQWVEGGEFFVAEADEYVTDPSAPSRGEEITPRFSFLHPWLTVCTNLRFDHPDVYRDFDHTQEVYRSFFSQILTGGYLIVNGDDENVMNLAAEVKGKSVLSYGEKENCDFRLLNFSASNGVSSGECLFADQTLTIRLKIPGRFNIMNAMAAVLSCAQLGVPAKQSIQVLEEFSSTLRRSEFVGEKHGVKFYDDYAHHPNEVALVIQAFREWFPSSRLIIAFQSHTFSRTKALFDEFVDAFGQASQVVMIDIFPSARESFDPSVTSDLLCAAIEKKFPNIPAKNVRTLENLAKYFTAEAHEGDVVLTLGAGDIYRVHQMITK